MRCVLLMVKLARQQCVASESHAYGIAFSRTCTSRIFRTVSLVTPRGLKPPAEGHLQHTLSERQREFISRTLKRLPPPNLTTAIERACFHAADSGLEHG